MAYNPNEFMLKEGTIDYGTITDPDLIDGTADPNDSYTLIDNVGYIRMGTIAIMMPDERVEYLSNTPHILIADDLLRRSWFWEFTLNQFNKDAVGLFQRRLVVSSTYEIMHVGPDEEVPTLYCFRLRSFRRDGTAYNAFIYSGAASNDDAGRKASGTDYVDMPIRIKAFAHSAFDLADQTDLKKAYGMEWYPASS